MTLGQVGYEAYCKHTNWKSLATGADLPQWSDLLDAIKEAWEVTARAVASQEGFRHFKDDKFAKLKNGLACIAICLQCLTEFEDISFTICPNCRGPVPLVSAKLSFDLQSRESAEKKVRALVDRVKMDEAYRQELLARFK
jgi:hypothetical protein